jgi:nicotinamide riboside transporter PnuC
LNENLFGLTANLIDACFLVVGKSGKILNARGNRICFLLDICCLSYWVHMDIMRGLYSQAVSAVLSICICIYGFRKWGKNMSKNQKKESKKPKKEQMSNQKQAEIKAKIAKAPLVPNRLPFDQGTCI